MKRMAVVRKCQGQTLLFIFNVSIPVLAERWRGCSEKQLPRLDQLMLLKVFKPLVTQEPFFVDFVVGPIVFGLHQKVVQPVDKVEVVFVDGPGQLRELTLTSTAKKQLGL